MATVDQTIENLDDMTTARPRERLHRRNRRVSSQTRRELAEDITAAEFEDRAGGRSYPPVESADGMKPIPL